MGCCNVLCGLKFGAVLGAIMAVLGGILIPVGRMIIEDTVKKESVIEPGTTAYDNWAATGALVYRQFWIFEVTNPTEVVKNGSKPVVRERGPYTYRTRYLAKDNVTFSDNHTVSYLLPMGAIFEPSMSVGPEEDRVTTLNLILPVVYKIFSGGNNEVSNLKTPLFQNRTVKELLWGYRDTPLNIPVGLFYNYNETFDGLYTVHTGKDDISKVGLIEEWREQKTLNFWKDQYCDMINGTDASSFPPFVDKEKPLYFFSSDICRSVAAGYEASKDLKGIEVYRYTLQSDTLAAPTVNPDNLCFCTDRVISRNCTMAGVLDVESCLGAPVYISLPHFLHGSEFLRENVLGLNPSEEHHVTYLDVEPITGFTLRFAKRIQVNMMYGPSNKFIELKNVQNHTIFPIVWLNETAALDDPTADMFKRELFSRIETLEVIQWTLLGAGLALFVSCTAAYCVMRKRKQTF